MSIPSRSSGMRGSVEDAYDAVFQSCTRRGTGSQFAHALADASVLAEAEGLRAVGLAHALDYLDAMDDGRISLSAIPSLEAISPVLLAVDADAGRMPQSILVLELERRTGKM